MPVASRSDSFDKIRHTLIWQASRTSPSPAQARVRPNMGGHDSDVFRIDGDTGSIRGTLGLLYDYPHGRPDTLEVMSDVVPTNGWIPYPVIQCWIPDACSGAKGVTLAGITTGEPARSTIRDSVRTLRLVEAFYESIANKAEVLLPRRQARSMLDSQKPHSKQTRPKDVAELAEVSLAPASRVLKNDHMLRIRISDTRRQLVVGAARPFE